MLGTLDEHQIEQVLKTEWVGRLGCHQDGVTYIVPICYAYEGNTVYAHSAEGQKLRMLRQNPDVCFEVEHVESLANWKSVIAWGRFEELRGEQADEALRLLLKRLVPRARGEVSMPPQAIGHGSGSAVIYRIVLDRKTGRFER